MARSEDTNVFDVKTENVRISSSKGSLAAVIHYPEEKTERLAILCPGYLDSKDYKGMVGLAEALCEHGYVVVRFDPTGTWESGGNISDYTTTQYLEDIRNVLEYMHHQANYLHILLGGHSRGGQIVLLYAARDARISIMVGIMPSARYTMKDQRHEEWMKNGVSVSHRDLPNNKDQTKEFHVPISHLNDHNQYDVMEDVKRIHVPVILIAGELDTTCRPERVKEIYDNANKPKAFTIMPGIGHDYRHNNAEVKLVNKQVLKMIMSNEPKTQ